MLKINYIPNGKTFVEKSGAVNVRFREISQHEYNRLTSLDQREVNETVANDLPEGIVLGYGYYGFRYFEDKGRFYIGAKIGRSCD